MEWYREPKVRREESQRLTAPKLDHKFSLMAQSQHWPLRQKTAHYCLILCLCSAATEYSHTRGFKHIHESTELKGHTLVKTEGKI